MGIPSATVRPADGQHRTQLYMNTRRKFGFPLATLTRSAGLLHGAIINPAYKQAMEERLGDDFTGKFANAISAVTGTSVAQSSQTGDVSGLTLEQATDLKEMERLVAGARRTAKLAFPGQDTVLRAEFQVGNFDSKTFASEIERARKTHAAVIKYAAELKSKGWIPADTVSLGQAIADLHDSGLEKEGASDDRLGMTNEKIIGANTLYTYCLTVQNAARLQFPIKTDANGGVMNVTERARFLLEEFPPPQPLRTRRRHARR